MDDLRTLYFQIPPITRYYLTSLFITATIATYIKSLAFIIYAIFLDYNLIIKKFHIWRLFTNVLFFGGFSPQFLFFVIMVYFHFKSQERTSIILRAYATFIMMLIYLLIFINIINIIATKMFGLNAGFTLGPQLILSLIYIDSKREPQKIVSLYFFRMQNCYFPYALILLNIVSGGGIYDNIIGIIAGNLYYTLKDVLPVSKNINILKTLPMIPKEKKTKKNHIKKKKVYKDFNDYELNSFSYIKALKYDKRTFLEYYISLLKVKHPILFSFCPIKDYNTMIVKLSMFILSFAIYYGMNSLFFNEVIVHKIYEEGGGYNFKLFLIPIFALLLFLILFIA